MKLGPQRLFAVRQRKRDLGHAERLMGVRAVEDDVLHLGAAERLRTLLSENPPDCVGDVALAAAIGTDNGRHARFEFQLGFFREALETDKFEALKIQGERPS